MTTATNHMRVGLTLTQELRPDPSHSNVLAPGESVDLHMVSKADLFGAERLVIPSDISWKLQVDAILVDGRPQPLGNTYCPGTAQACRREDVFQSVGAYIYNEFAVGCRGDYDVGKTFVVRVTNRSDQAATLRAVVLGREARAVEAASKSEGEPVIVETNPTAPKSKGEPVIVQMTNPSDRPAVVRRSFKTYDVESKDAPTEPGFTRAVGVFTSGKEAELLRTLGEQVSGKSLFGFELTAPILEAMTAPDRRLDEDPAPLHAVSHVVGPAIRYYVMVACDRETACRLVQSFWHGIWGSVALRHREISPEAALHRGARVFLERPSGWVDDGTSADPEHRFSFVEDRWALAALLAAMVRDAR